VFLLIQKQRNKPASPGPQTSDSYQCFVIFELNFFCSPNINIYESYLGFGWHGGAFMKEPHYTGEIGVFTSKYVRMEKCGQLDVLGRYSFNYLLLIILYLYLLDRAVN
jgi:hypothetical protein